MLIGIDFTATAMRGESPALNLLNLRNVRYREESTHEIPDIAFTVHHKVIS